VPTGAAALDLDEVRGGKNGAKEAEVEQIKIGWQEKVLVFVVEQ